LPSYIQCDLSHISNEDISFLRRKGCFTFPKKDLLDDLLKCYFDYVHPHVPFLDEQEFWETQHFHHTDGYRISLILFQAVLFAATACAPLSVLRRAGYTSRRVARRAAFDRVHALYFLDAERDKMVLLQALLLMSFWRGGSSEDKDGWHWSGLAFSLAFDLYLHRQPDAHLTARQETLRKRCWWSCVLRDRLLALSEQRAPRLQLNQSNVPLLTLADYNVGLRCAISELSPGEELGKRTALSMFSLQLIRLVLCIGDGFPSNSKDMKNSSPPALETWARTRPAIHNDSSITGLADLDFWRLNLPEVLQRPTDPAGDDTVLSCILVHRNALEIYYQ
ncbi:fungal-specific transcription factor domain-containing protein, partial [Apiosordaria backusii]